MKTLLYGPFQLFNEINNLIKSKNVYNPDEEFYFGCPLCKKVMYTDDVQMSDYHESNVWVSCENSEYNYECDHLYMLCYGNKDYNYCVEQISCEEAEIFLKEQDILNEYEMKFYWNYYLVNIVLITHLVKVEDKIKFINENNEDDTNNPYFSKLNSPVYDYGIFDKDNSIYDAYNHAGFYYKCECENCGNNYVDYSSGY